MIDLVRGIVKGIARVEGRRVGLDRLDLEMMPDSLSKELAAMMGIVFEDEQERRERPPLLLVAVRV